MKLGVTGPGLPRVLTRVDQAKATSVAADQEFSDPESSSPAPPSASRVHPISEGWALGPRVGVRSLGASLGASGAGSGAWRGCRKRRQLRTPGSKRPQTPETAEVAASRLLSNPGRRVGAAGRPRSPRRSPAAAPPSRPSPPPAGCCARFLAGRSGARGARAAAAASRTSPRPARGLVRPWPARSSSGRGGGRTATLMRQRRPCRTRSWPWRASTCFSTTASGSRISFSNNTGDAGSPSTLCPGCAHRVVTSRPEAALFPVPLHFPAFALRLGPILLPTPSPAALTLPSLRPQSGLTFCPLSGVQSLSAACRLISHRALAQGTDALEAAASLALAGLGLWLARAAPAAFVT